MRRLFPGHASYYGELVDCLFGQIGLSPGEFNPLGIVVFDSVSVISNLLGVAMSVFYVFKKELYADLPHDIPGSPSFRPEVCCKSKEIP